MTAADIDTICVLIRFKNGNVHQLLVDQDQCWNALEHLTNKQGGFSVSEKIEWVKMNSVNKEKP